MRDIPLKAIPFGDSYEHKFIESNIAELNSGLDGLRIVVEFWKLKESNIKQKVIEVFLKGILVIASLKKLTLCHIGKAKSFRMVI